MFYRKIVRLKEVANDKTDKKVSLKGSIDSKKRLKSFPW